MSPDYVGLAVLSLFCIGGLLHYAPEARRLRQLLAAGVVREATVTSKERIDSGSESVVHYLVTYEFADEQGGKSVREDDLNDGRFFDGLSVGDRVEILAEPGSTGNACPASRVRADARIATGISIGLVALWLLLGAYLLFRGAAASTWA